MFEWPRLAKTGQAPVHNIDYHFMDERVSTRSPPGACMKISGLVLALLAACLAVEADEGMWTFDNPPLDRIKAKYNFVPDEKWLEHIRLAAVEFGSASGAFVSKDGLVLTNHHVGLRYIEKVSEREHLQAIMRDQAGRIARQRFALYGKSLYPDATGTLRFSYGAVEGYTEQGKQIEPCTTFAGLYERALQKGPEAANGAWALPARWLERKGQLDLNTPLNFCHKVDITGGNSGSPTINTKGEFVGVLFDSNRQSLPGKFYYDEKVNRAVSLDSRAILEALVKVYDAKHLADELLAK
jgi:hypothetical protein